jgi:mRNA-degrading endonuclease toxin of MazEF toxin-antitoxin module
VTANPGWSELWIVEAGGSRRPALVLSRPEVVDRVDRILVALATTRVRGLPSEVAVGADEGLSDDCVLNLDTPELLSRNRFTSYIADFPVDRWSEICYAIQVAINCFESR